MYTRNTTNARGLQPPLLRTRRRPKLQWNSVTIPDMSYTPATLPCKKCWRSLTLLSLRCRAPPTRSRRSGWRMGVFAWMSPPTKISKRTYEIRLVNSAFAIRKTEWECRIVSIGLNIRPCCWQSDDFDAPQKFVSSLNFFQYGFGEKLTKPVRLRLQQYQRTREESKWSMSAWSFRVRE